MEPQRLSSYSSQPQQRVPSGFKALDELLEGGFAPGALCVISGRPGMGKLAFAQQCALNAALQGIPVLYFSLQWNGSAVVSHMLRTQACADPAAPAFIEAAAAFAETPFYIDDSTEVSALTVGDKAQSWIERDVDPRREGVAAQARCGVGLLAAIEGGRAVPSILLLARLVAALGQRLHITFKECA